jgi:hypothetical protein
MARDHKVRFAHFVEALNAMEESTEIAGMEKRVLNVGPEDLELMYSF